MIAVVGPGEGATEQSCMLASEVGRLLALRGAVVFTGGLGGVMAAAARGAGGAGGVAVGLLPGLDRAAGNADNTVAIATGLGQARNALIVRAADAMIAVGGSWGTLSEIALCRRAGKPVVCLRGWQILDSIGQEVPLDVASSPEHAIDLLAQALGWASAPD
ncbi:MAG: hypothetical protein QOD45_613 [Pseudonocardiales bacterium]|jgi:uncharacterized protein (TIGR00725 family)|nr:hypothetical protein [Pseudonocardiales bacterium]